MGTSRSRELTELAAALWPRTTRYDLDELPKWPGYRNLSEYPGYAVSVAGDVATYRGNGRGWTRWPRALPPPRLKPTLSARGILQVRLQLVFPYRSVRVYVPVAELVAAAYPRRITGATSDGRRPDPSARLVLRDGNPSNCAVTNLEWQIPESRKAEIARERRERLQRRQAKLTPRQVGSIRQQLERGVETSTLARRYHVTPQTIRRIGRGVTWRAA